MSHRNLQLFGNDILGCTVYWRYYVIMCINNRFNQDLVLHLSPLYV